VKLSDYFNHNNMFSSDRLILATDHKRRANFSHSAIDFNSYALFLFYIIINSHG